MLSVPSNVGVWEQTAFHHSDSDGSSRPHIKAMHLQISLMESVGISIFSVLSWIPPQYLSTNVSEFLV
ncbi:hypothetical protein SDJN03_01639, partial [Cucurbita argyrosperma subsp. sororia]